jgi:acetolactate synthase-1/3 small subunit
MAMRRGAHSGKVMKALGSKAHQTVFSDNYDPDALDPMDALPNTFAEHDA